MRITEPAGERRHGGTHALRIAARLAARTGITMGLKALFTEHPASLGETYPQHMRASLGYAVPLLGASLAAFVHALFPFLFKATASGSVKRLYERMTRRCAGCPSGRLHRPDLFAPPSQGSALDRRAA
ncbi:DUF6356 family protein [Methylobacterium nigriterrae]|uniref:DUF6356 family protein n=1 Tax=Methylobacterium nigriterrae TaxID=3127512 RepID=UPI003D6716F3